MEETKNARNLYQRLVEVRKSVKYIQKNADGYKFKYATEGQILAALREAMDNESVFLEMEMVSLEPVECHVILDKQVRPVPGLKGVFEFIWTNADSPQEQIKRKVIVQDSESVIKTCGGLMTYANKYFLYKFFSVPTDKLDPDAFSNGLDKIVDFDGDEEDGEDSEVTQSGVSGITTRQKNFLKSLLGQLNNKTYEVAVCGKHKLKSIFDIDKSLFNELINDLKQKIYEKSYEKAS